MEYTEITALLEKYWSAETTVEEEKLLAAYFRQPTIAPGLEPYRELFAWFGEEAALTPGEGLEQKILDSIGQPITRPDAQSTARPAITRSLYGKTSWYAAAAVILLVMSVFLYQPMKNDGNGTGTPVAQNNAGTRAREKAALLGDNIKDTYDDPQQALAAIRRALLTASVKMNQGKNITRQQIGRMNDSWQSAISN